MNAKVSVTGASVRIRTHVPSPTNPQSPIRTATAFWVGLNLPNDAFIQVGYHCIQATGYPQWFWEYFPPTTASSGSGFSHGSLTDQEEQVGPDNSWHTYSLQSNGGNTWYTFVDGTQVGSYDMGASNSNGNTPYALAEVTDVVTTDIVLGPVEFANLSYRDMNNAWYPVPEAFAWMGYGAGSGILPSGMNFPYGLQVLGVNDWIAGSGYSLADNYTTIWNKSGVVPEFPSTLIPTLILSLALPLILLQKMSKKRKIVRPKIPI